MSDDPFASGMFEILSHIGHCQECKQKWSEAQKLIQQVADHRLHKDGT